MKIQIHLLRSLFRGKESENFNRSNQRNLLLEGVGWIKTIFFA